jgi:hypothetical protein
LPPLPPSAPAAAPAVVPVIAPAPAAPVKPVATAAAPAPRPPAGAVVVQRPDHSLQLDAETAVLRGKDIKLIPHERGNANIGAWRNTQITVTWTVAVRTPGRFRVIARYGCPGDEIGSEFTITAGTARLTASTLGTPGWERFREADLGVLEIPKAGDIAVVVQATRLARTALMNLNRLTLKPE